MDDAGAVRRRKRIGDLRQVLHRVTKPDAPRSDPVLERSPGHVLHHDEVDVMCAIDVVDRDDVGMVQCRRGLGFVHEAPVTVAVGVNGGPEHFDGHRTIEPRVAGLVDDAHAALADLGGDFVWTEPRTGSERHSRWPFYASGASGTGGAA